MFYDEVLSPFDVLESSRDSCRRAPRICPWSSVDSMQQQAIRLARSSTRHHAGEWPRPLR